MNAKKISFMLIIFLSKLFFSCSYFRSPGLSFNINNPSLVGQASSLYTSFQAVQIPITITNSSGFKLQTTLNSGANSVQIPTGNIHIKIGYLAVGITSTTFCGSNSGGPNNVLYTEFETDFNITNSTESININFPQPFSVIPMDHFGFIVKDKNGNLAQNATIYYYDLISEQNIIDPCKGTSLNDTADSQGRIAVDFPIYSNTLKMRFIVQTADGDKKKFEPTFVRGSPKAQFYYLNMSDGSITAMDENNESFLQDGFSIAYTRDVLMKNPRFPDFYSYVLQSPDPYTYSVFLGPQSNNQDPYSLMNRRSLDIYCKITDYTNSNILYPNQICPRNPFVILTLNMTWTYGQSYNIYAYAIDKEGYQINPSNSYVPFSYAPL